MIKRYKLVSDSHHFLHATIRLSSCLRNNAKMLFVPSHVAYLFQVSNFFFIFFNIYVVSSSSHQLEKITNLLTISFANELVIILLVAFNALSLDNVT